MIQSTKSMENNYKKSYPVTLAKYAIDDGIDKENAFDWWLRYTMKKADHIVSKIPMELFFGR